MDPSPQVEYSFWQRLWTAIKPPPAVRSPRPDALAPATPETLALQRRRQRLKVVGWTVAGLGAAGAGGYYYNSQLPVRAAEALRAGTMYSSLGRHQEAIGYFDRVIGLDSHVSGVYRRRGAAFQALGQTERALQDFDRALAEDPRDAAAYTARGMIFRGRGEVQKALEEISRGLAIREDNGSYYERALIYEQLGDYTKALEDVNRLVAGLVDAPHALRFRALLKQKMGDQVGARADIDVAKRSEQRASDAFKGGKQ